MNYNPTINDTSSFVIGWNITRDQNIHFSLDGKAAQSELLLINSNMAAQWAAIAAHFELLLRENLVWTPFAVVHVVKILKGMSFLFSVFSRWGKGSKFKKLWINVTFSHTNLKN